MTRISLLLVLLITLWGCDKNGSLPVEPPIQPKAELKISPEKEVIPYGDEITITWKGIDSKYGLLNGLKVENEGSIKQKALESVSFSFQSVNGSLSSSLVTKSIKVGDWTASIFGLMTYSKPFYISSDRVYQDGVKVFDAIFSEERKSETFYLTIEGKAVTYDSRGKKVGDSGWLPIDDTHFKMGDFIYEIKLITKDKFVYTIIANWKGQPSVYETTYYRIL